MGAARCPLSGTPGSANRRKLVDRIISETRYMVLIAVVALAVAFLARVANWNGESTLLPFGIAIAAVVVALGAFSYLKRVGLASSGSTRQHVTSL